MNLRRIYFLCMIFYFMRPHEFICVNKYKWCILSVRRVPTDSFNFHRTYQRLVVFDISWGRKKRWIYFFHIGSYFFLFVPEGDTSIWKAYQLWAQRWDHSDKLIFKSLLWILYSCQRKFHDSINRCGLSILRHSYQKFWKWILKNLRHEVERVAESEISPNWHVFISIFSQ